MRTLGEEDLSGSPGAGYITADNICKTFANLIPPLGDVQVYFHPQVLGRGKKITQHGFSVALATQPAQVALRFSVWPEWNFQWIGNHLDVLKHYPNDYEKARDKVETIKNSSIKKGIENLQ